MILFLVNGFLPAELGGLGSAGRADEADHRAAGAAGWAEGGGGGPSLADAVLPGDEREQTDRRQIGGEDERTAGQSRD